jgi:Family of unknown function (DUF5995)
MTSGSSIADLIQRMERMLEPLVLGGDPLRFFLATYLRMTKAVHDELARGGFLDNVWTERWDVEFARLYLEALEQWQQGTRPSEPWVIAFEAARGERLPPLRHVLLGMNAHINYDLPQALLAVITDPEFSDHRILERRASDHRHIDDMLVDRVAEEDRHLAVEEQPGDRTLLDRMLTPFNRAATRRFLREARRKVWRNSLALAASRRDGPEAFDRRLHQLERLSAARVADLRAPGQVIMRLGIHGFGVLLPSA